MLSPGFLLAQHDLNNFKKQKTQNYRKGVVCVTLQRSYIELSLYFVEFHFLFPFWNNSFMQNGDFDWMRLQIV